MNPCYAYNLCKLDDPSIEDCAAWCCESHGGYVFLAIFLAALGAFLLMYAHYTKRLHEENVKTGAVNEDGKRAAAPGAETEVPQTTKRLRAVFTPKGAKLAPAR